MSVCEKLVVFCCLQSANGYESNNDETLAIIVGHANILYRIAICIFLFSLFWHKGIIFLLTESKKYYKNCTLNKNDKNY